jgi:hypothetical protein
MEERITLSREPRTAAEYRAAVDALIAEMKRMNERSEETWAEIERLKAETEAIKAENEVTKASLQARLDDLLART